MLRSLVFFLAFSVSATAQTDTALLKTVTVNRPGIQRQGDKLTVTVAGNPFFKTATNTADVLRKIPGVEISGDGTLLLSGRITPAIFIDGRPTPLGIDEINIDMIASIEVISNPSAQFDGEHKGIINIKLKPDRSLGWKGTLGSTVQRNEYTWTDNNLLLSYKTKKAAYTGRLGHTTGNTVRTYNALQYLASGDRMATSTKTVTGNNNLNIQLGADYNISKNNHIELLLRSYDINRDIHSDNTLSFTSDKTKNVTNAKSGQFNKAINLNYAGKFLQVLSSVISIKNKQTEDIRNGYVDHWKTNSANDILIRTVQADVAKGKWKLGAKFSFNTTTNDIRYDTLTKSNEFELDSSRTNWFRYDEYVTAAYVSFEKKWSNFQFTTGLRAEHTHSVAADVERDYLTWLPSLNLVYKQWNLSITRRITRPQFALLNPFRFYFSPLNYWVGNPQLLPSKTNVINLSYDHKRFTAAVNFGKEVDPMTRYPEYNRVTNVLEYLGKNLPYNYFAGLDVSVPLTVTRWWRMNNNVGIYYKKEQTPYHGVTYEIPVMNYNFNGSQVFALPKQYTLDVYYAYRSPGGDGLYFGRPESNIDLGLQKTWFKGKLNSKLNYYDIFNGYRVRRVFREKEIINNRLQHWFGTRRVVVTLVYNFGQSTYKAKQASKNEEETRAGM